MRRPPSLQSSTILEEPVGDRAGLQEELIPDARGAMAPAEWVEQKLLVLLQDIRPNADV